MQQIYPQQRQTNDRLSQQLTTNIIKKATTPVSRKHIDKISKSTSNHVDKLTDDNRRQSSLQRLRNDVNDCETHRSLSTCPTYSSLSRHSNQTRVSEYETNFVSLFMIMCFRHP